MHVNSVVAEPDVGVMVIEVVKIVILPRIVSLLLIKLYSPGGGGFTAPVFVLPVIVDGLNLIIVELLGAVPLPMLYHTPGC